MRVVEAFHDLVRATGTIGVMSSGQGSLTNNTNGNYAVYRGSKAALNMFMRSFAARHLDDAKTLLLMAPGWVRTALSGAAARLSIRVEERRCGDEGVSTSRNNVAATQQK